MGCIGSSLVKELRKNPDNVVYEINSRMNPLNNLLQGNLRYLCNEVYNPYGYLEIEKFLTNIKNIEGKDVDAIYNCSGCISEKYRDLISSNVIVTINLLDAVYSLKINSSIVLIGSAAEYGTHGVNLEYDDCDPSSFYGMSKLNQTFIAKQYVKKNNMNIKIVRPSNVFSEQARNTNTIVGKVFSHDFENGKLKLGNLSAMRDYIHVDDVVSALICVSEHGVSGEIYNVGSFDAVTVRNVVKYIMKIRGLDYDSLIEESIEKLQGISLSFLNNIKLKNLGWSCNKSEFLNYTIRMI